MTNLDIITAAYRMGNVIPMVATPSPELGEEGLTYLNDMLANWANDTIDLGWFPQSDLSADAPLDKTAVEAVKANLAVILCGVGGVDPPEWVVRTAERGYNTLLRGAIHDAMEPQDMSHMPMGSGHGSDDFDIETGNF